MLWPSTSGQSELRREFIRKAYIVRFLQFALSFSVGGVAVSVELTSHFFLSPKAGMVVVIVFPLILTIWLYYHRRGYPDDLVLRVLFATTTTMSFTVGLCFAFSTGIKMVSEAVIPTTILVFSLTLYTSWAAKSCPEFNFLAIFVFAGCCLSMRIVHWMLKIWRAIKQELNPIQSLKCYVRHLTGILTVKASHATARFNKKLEAVTFTGGKKTPSWLSHKAATSPASATGGGSGGRHVVEQGEESTSAPRGRLQMYMI